MARAEFLLIFVLAVAPAAGAGENGFAPIFDGKSLEGWDGDTRFWSVRDGAITGRSTEEMPARENTFLIWRRGEVDDFELHLSYRIEAGNSGVQYRSRDLGNWRVGGYQADIEAGATWTGALYDEAGRGVLAQRGEKAVVGAAGERKAERFADPGALLAAVSKDGWNEYAISACGNRMVHSINGRVMSEVVDGAGVRSGILALQLHAGPPMTVQFKDIRLKRFPLEDRKKLVLIAGRASHGQGEHAHGAGVMLLKSCLDALPATVNAAYFGGWPEDPTAFDNADAVMVFADGGGGHPAMQGNRLEELARLAERGCGLAMIHYAVEVPKGRGGARWQEWIGGYYETGYSTNPVWTARFEALPDHPIARGVEPFSLRDEWYFNMRFRDEGVTEILKAVPPDDVRRTAAAKAHPGRAEVVAWCVERAGGGRGFGFTGGHWHANWGNDGFRTVVLNALYWVAGAEVPPGGVPSSVTAEELERT